jgi:hypothetical protein
MTEISIPDGPQKALKVDCFRLSYDVDKDEQQLNMSIVDKSPRFLDKPITPATSEPIVFSGKVIVCRKKDDTIVTIKGSQIPYEQNDNCLDDEYEPEEDVCKFQCELRSFYWKVTNLRKAKIEINYVDFEEEPFKEYKYDDCPEPKTVKSKTFIVSQLLDNSICYELSLKSTDVADSLDDHGTDYGNYLVGICTKDEMKNEVLLYSFEVTVSEKRSEHGTKVVEPTPQKGKRSNDE